MVVHKDDPWIEKVTDSDVVDPLSGPARSERTGLLVSNLAFFVVVHMGLSLKRLEGGGLSTADINPQSAQVLVWVVLVYYWISFGLTVGAELRAWRSRLEALKERRQLRQLWYLERRLAAPPELQFDELNKENDEERRMLMIIASNRAQQLDWAEYQRMYRLRMILDGFFPLVLTVANVGFEIVKQVI